MSIMVNIIVRVIAFIGTIISLGSAIFVFVKNLQTKKLQQINQELDKYVKRKDFLLMKNDGENPWETKNKFGMPLISQESDYIIRRKSLWLH